MAITGLRPDEGRRLQYRDVTNVKDEDTRERILEIEVRGKRGVGYCKCMRGAVTPTSACASWTVRTSTRSKAQHTGVLSLQAKLVTIDNIQKTVADYYKVRVADLRVTIKPRIPCDSRARPPLVLYRV